MGRGARNFRGTGVASGNFVKKNMQYVKNCRVLMSSELGMRGLIPVKHTHLGVSESFAVRNIMHFYGTCVYSKYECKHFFTNCIP